MREYLTECIGTFFLVFTVCLTVLNGTPGAALASIAMTSIDTVIPPFSPRSPRMSRP